MTVLGIDLGSAKCGVCAIDGKTIVGAATIPVDTKNLRPTVDRITAAIVASGSDRVAIEWSERPYTPKNATPQAMASIMFARETMAKILDRIEQWCETKGIGVVKLACATWRARIGVSRRRQAGVAGLRQAAWARLNPRRDTTDRRVRNAVERLLGPEADALRDVHQRDAAGVVMGMDRADAVARRAIKRSPGDARKRTAHRDQLRREQDALADAMLEESIARVALLPLPPATRYRT